MLSIKDKIILLPIYVISLLPLWVQYRLSDFLFLIAFHLIGYRKKVVLENLRNSFPEKTEEERIKIAKKFYLHLCDVFFESLSLLSMSPATAKKRFTLTNPEVMHEFISGNKNIIIATNHYANWEWGVVFSLLFPEFLALAIYRPLSNKLFDRFFVHLRSGYGVKPTPMKKVLREIINAKRENKLIGVYSLADQRPGMEDLSYWTTFLNQDTPMITGVEKLAKKFNLAVVFMDIDKVKRGRYVTTFRVISENPKDESENAITEKYARTLETMIQRKPELWLWTHKRWKFKKSDFTSESKNIND